MGMMTLDEPKRCDSGIQSPRHGSALVWRVGNPHVCMRRIDSQKIYFKSLYSENPTAMTIQSPGTAVSLEVCSFSSIDSRREQSSFKLQDVLP
jgi:hypothetical protein